MCAKLSSRPERQAKKWRPCDFILAVTAAADLALTQMSCRKGQVSQTRQPVAIMHLMPTTGHMLPHLHILQSLLDMVHICKTQRPLHLHNADLPVTIRLLLHSALQ